MITLHQFNSYNGDLILRRAYKTEEIAIAAARKLDTFTKESGGYCHIRLTRTPKIIMNSKLPEPSVKLEAKANWQTQARGTNSAEYDIYLACADNGKGGDITRGGAPLLTFNEWIAA